jgi:hypothetical protein
MDKKRKRNTVGLTSSHRKLEQGNSKKLKLSENYNGRRLTMTNTIGLNELVQKVYDVGTPDMKVVRLVYNDGVITKLVQSRINRTTNTVSRRHLNWRPLNSNLSPNITYFFEITIVNYMPGGLHTNHAIGAVKRGNHLYVFDPHGRQRQPITTLCAERLANICHVPRSNIIIFDGPANSPVPQAANTQGACVAFADGFLVFMAGLISGKRTKANGRTWRNIQISRNNFNNTVHEHFRPISTNATSCQQVFRNLTAGTATISYPIMNRN